MQFPTFQELMTQDSIHDPLVLKRLLIQAIASLSTQPKFCIMTPDEVYSHIVTIAKEVSAEMLDVTMLSKDELAQAIIKCVESNDPSDRTFAKHCVEELKKRK